VVGAGMLLVVHAALANAVEYVSKFSEDKCFSLLQ